MAEEKNFEAGPEQLTDAEKAAIEAWFKKHAQKAICPVCQSQSWTVGQDFVTPLVLSGKDKSGLNLGGKIYPFFMLICRVCGAVQFVNAILSKVLSGGNKKEGGA